MKKKHLQNMNGEKAIRFCFWQKKTLKEFDKKKRLPEFFIRKIIQKAIYHS